MQYIIFFHLLIGCLYYGIMKNLHDYSDGDLIRFVFLIVFWPTSLMINLGEYVGKKIKKDV
jgi:hypothetical protein